MIKAGALYFAIVMALVISLLSSSLILLAAHYRNSYLKQLRYARLVNNLKSSVTLILANPEFLSGETKLDLFKEEMDSVIIAKSYWGIFEFATVQAFQQQDTLKCAFLIGSQSDSTALYLSDEDRPLSISGKTFIKGNVALPKSGLRKAYLEGIPYAYKELIQSGKMTFSGRKLMPLDSIILSGLFEQLNNNRKSTRAITQSINQSHFHNVQEFLLPSVSNLTNINLNGNVILFSDSIVNISASAKLRGIQIYAPCIKVEAGFEGEAQFFARDSVVIGNKVKLTYPSVIGVIRMPKSGTQPAIHIGNNVQIDGIVFSYEAKRSPLQTLITLGSGTTINGEIYCSGILNVTKNLTVNGSVSCNRFLMRNKTAIYENFLVDVNFNRLARNKHYLSTTFFNRGEKQIMAWLN